MFFGQSFHQKRSMSWPFCIFATRFLFKTMKRSLRLVVIIRKMRKDYLFSGFLWKYQILCEIRLSEVHKLVFYLLLGLSWLILTILTNHHYSFPEIPKTSDSAGLSSLIFTNLILFFGLRRKKMTISILR